MTEPNMKHVSIVLEVPRDPDENRYTLHKSQRRRYRRDPRIKDWIIDEVIEEGHCSGRDVDGGLVPEATEGDVFAFEKEVWSEGRHDWEVIVSIKPEAFVEDDVKHNVVTAYCGCHSEDASDCDGARSSSGVSHA